MDKAFLRAARRYYKARSAAEKHYGLTHERLSKLMRRGHDTAERRRIGNTYRRLKTKELEAWERYWPFLEKYGYEYESAMKSILRHI